MSFRPINFRVDRPQNFRPEGERATGSITTSVTASSSFVGTDSTGLLTVATVGSQFDPKCDANDGITTAVTISSDFVAVSSRGDACETPWPDTLGQITLSE